MTAILKILLMKFTYVALIALLVAGSFGLPIPEDIPLIFSGYLCHPTESPLAQLDDLPTDEFPLQEYVPSRWIMIVCGLIGVLGGDSALYWVGRNGIDSDNFVAHHLRKVMHSRRRAWVKLHFARHGNLTLFVGRFLPGARSVIFAMAGMSRMKYSKFLLIDAIAAGISAPAFILLGYFCAPHITQFFALMNHLRQTFLAICVLVAVGIVVIYAIRRKRRVQEA